MKILFVTDLYPVKSGEATTPATLHNFVFEWIKQGHSVTVIKPNFILNTLIRDKPLYLNGFYDYNGVQIYNVNYFTPFWFKFLNKIPKEVKFSNYDVVIGHMPSGVIFANKFAATTRTPLVCGVHYSDIEVLTNPVYQFYFKDELKDAYKRSIKIACRSFVLQQKFCKIMPEYASKTFVASSGISPDKYIIDPSSTFTGHSNFMLHSPVRVITCANLIKRKNIAKLILAIKELENFELTVIGDGTELNRLKEINAKNVRFLGRLSNEKVLKEMQKSDIFILPSENETFGMVYLEAMSSGCITIGTKNDGIDGIIKDSENGFLCEPNIESIKETLLKVKDFKNIDKIRQKGIETIKKYSTEICASNYLLNCCS